MTNNQILSLATELKNNHVELRHWRITFNNRKRAFGVCHHTKTEIQISSVLAPVMSDESIRDTIIHEIAHALTKGHGHDNVWRRKCIELGGNGNRVGGSDKFKDGEEGRLDFHKANAKYTLTCPTCGYESFRNRQPKRSCSCPKHGGGYNEMHKLSITQNY